MNALQAVIYDMDGLLIDSEPFWIDSEIEVLRPLGVPLTREMCMQTAGIRVDKVVQHWHGRFAWDAQRHPLATMTEKIVTGVIERVRARGKVLPGVMESIDFFKRQQLKMAIASSSHHRLIRAVLDRFELGKHFAVVKSAENEPYGKPHPGVFINAASSLAVDPQHCLVLEDSIYGAIAAKAAMMKCIVVPATHDAEDPRFAIADLKLSSLTEFNQVHWDTLNR